MDALTNEQIAQLIPQSRLEVYLKYLALNYSKEEQNFKTSDSETFLTSDNKVFKVKVA